MYCIVLLYVFLRPPEADVTPVTPKMFSFEGWTFYSKRRERDRARFLKAFQLIFLQPSTAAVNLVVVKMFSFTCSSDRAGRHFLRNFKKTLLAS